MKSLLDEISDSGGIRCLIGAEFYISVILALMLLIVGCCTDYRPQSSVFGAMFTASAAMLGLIIASYSLVLNAGDKEFKEVFYKHSTFKTLRIDFSMTTIYLGVSALMNLLIFILYDSVVAYSSFLIIPCVFMCVMGLLNVVVLMTNSLRLLGAVLSS